MWTNCHHQRHASLDVRLRTGLDVSLRTVLGETKYANNAANGVCTCASNQSTRSKEPSLDRVLAAPSPQETVDVQRVPVSSASGHILRVSAGEVSTWLCMNHHFLKRPLRRRSGPARRPPEKRQRVTIVRGVSLFHYQWKNVALVMSMRTQNLRGVMHYQKNRMTKQFSG